MPACSAEGPFPALDPIKSGKPFISAMKLIDTVLPSVAYASLSTRGGLLEVRALPSYCWNVGKTCSLLWRECPGMPQTLDP